MANPLKDAWSRFRTWSKDPNTPDWQVYAAYLSIPTAGTVILAYFWPTALWFLGAEAILALIWLLWSKFQRNQQPKPARPAPQQQDVRPMTPEPNSLNPSKAGWIRWSWTGFIGIILLLMTTNGIVLLASGSPLDFGTSAWFAVPVILLALSYRSIDYDEIASIKFEGYPVGNVGPGPKFIPWPLNLTPWPRGAQQEQFPGNPEEIFKGPDSETLPIMPNGKQMKRAIRITTGKPAGNPKEDPLAIQMALEFVFFLRMQIIDPLRFEIKYGDLEEFWRQVRDTGEKMLNSEVTSMAGVSDVIANTNQLLEKLQERLEELCLNGGVTVIESGLNAPDLTHALSAALRDIGVKRAEGAGSASVIRQEGAAKADAEAILIEKITAVLKDADPATIAAYVGQKALSDKTTVLGAEGIAQLTGLAALIANNAKGNNP